MTIEQEMRERIDQHIDRVGATADAGGTLNTAFARIMADVEVALVLARREGWDDLRLVTGGRLMEHQQSGDERYPLPKRIRQVLREEPVPSGRGPVGWVYRAARRARPFTPVAPAPAGDVPVPGGEA